MASAGPHMFKGFTKETFTFLQGLAANNNKPWFLEHKDDYEAHLLGPFQQLVAGLSGAMLVIDPRFQTRPAVDKTISRIYRDIRFSKDKSPYRAKMWLTFKRPRKEWKGAPAYFFELSLDGYRYGMGFYDADRANMDRLRELIAADVPGFQRLIATLDGGYMFKVSGERYKRVLRPDLPDDVQEWYQRRNLYLMVEREIDERLFSPQLADHILAGFEQVAPVYNFLWRVVESV
ncbi:MAG: DUF2461 domain-containing protein [Candidatus Neomarinimicrobiota bacterium]